MPLRRTRKRSRFDHWPAAKVRIEYGLTRASRKAGDGATGGANSETCRSVLAALPEPPYIYGTNARSLTRFHRRSSSLCHTAQFRDRPWPKRNRRGEGVPGCSCYGYEPRRGGERYWVSWRYGPPAPTDPAKPHHL